MKPNKKLFISRHMIQNYYSDAILKTIVLFVGKAMEEMYATMSILSVKSEHSIDLADAKMLMFEQLLHTKNGKNSLLSQIDTAKKMRDDILDEILRQYGIDKNEDTTEYHDEMIRVFNAQISHIEELITNNQYAKLYKIMS